MEGPEEVSEGTTETTETSTYDLVLGVILFVLLLISLSGLIFLGVNPLLFVYAVLGAFSSTSFIFSFYILLTANGKNKLFSVLSLLIGIGFFVLVISLFPHGSPPIMR
jgi:hypothetical protein